MNRRAVAAATAAAALLLVLVAPGTVLGGGWAEIRPDAATTTEPPIEGDPIEVGFTVLQHGVTPASWVHPTVTFTNAVTGEAVEASAEPQGGDGHFVARAIVPAPGAWSWTVATAELAVTSTPIAFTVRAADGTVPALDPAFVLESIERAGRDVSAGLRDEFAAEVGRLDTQLGAYRTEIERLRERVETLTAEREDLVARDAAGSSDGIPVGGVILIAVLAGATAGFAMAWLAGRPAPREIGLSPARRGSTPA
jgi:hypothetical protein